MKRKIEILLLWLIPALLVEGIVRFYATQLFGDFMDSHAASMDHSFDFIPGETYGDKLTYVNGINILSGKFTNLVIAGWLYWVTVNSFSKKILWAVSGVLLNYWSLLLFFGYQLYEQRESKKNDSP